MGRNFEQQLEHEFREFMLKSKSEKRHDLIKKLYVQRGYTKYNSILILDYAYITYFLLYSFLTIFCFMFYPLNEYHCLLVITYILSLIFTVIKEKCSGDFFSQLFYVLYNKKILSKVLFYSELATNSVIEALNRDYSEDMGKSVIQYLTGFGTRSVTNKRIIEFLKSPTQEDQSFMNNIHDYISNLNVKMDEIENLRVTLTEQHVLNSEIKVNSDLKSIKKIERL